MEPAVRTDMEGRFNHDFSRVRVHTDERAAESNNAIHARAFTMGSDIAFGAGQYSPRTAHGVRVLAHELAHVVQQDHSPTGRAQPFAINDQSDASEQEAKGAANTVASGGNVSALTASPSAPVLADRDNPSPPPPPPPPSQPAATTTCGPNVTAQVQSAVAHTKSVFGPWPAATRDAQCDALDSLTTGAVAWDIVQLHNNGWILGYRPACATQGATPPCGSTVQVGSDCYYAGSPNYVIFGTMCKLCHDHYAAASNPSGVARFTQSKMEYWVNAYKGTGFTGLATPSGNYAASRDWAIAGYNGWPTGGTPPSGDRNNCSPSCPTPYTGPAFTVNWVPAGII